MILSSLLLITTRFCLSFSIDINGKQCCDLNQVIDRETLKCMPKDILGDSDREQVNINISDNSLSINGCLGSLQVLNSNLVQLTSFGGLLVDGRIIQQGQFCRHTDTEGTEIVVLCNTCMKYDCIQQCCPSGQVRADDLEWRPPRCSTEDFHHWEPPKICSPSPIKIQSGVFSFQGKTYSKTDNMDPTGNFQCRKRETNYIYHLTYALTSYQTVEIDPKNWLNASYPGAEKGERVVHMYSPEDFCLAYIMEKVNGELLLEPSFMFCAPEPEPFEGKEFTAIFHPTALLISSLFLLMTLIAYLVDPELHKPIFGKITIGYVFNNLIAFLCLSVIYLRHLFSDFIQVPSISCESLGYLALYTFLCFMFWINAMAANIFFKFSDIMSANTVNDCKKLFYYALYAQGIPFLLCVFTFCMDKFGPCNLILPNMGKAQCFLGTYWSASVSSKTIIDDDNSTLTSLLDKIQWKAFFSSPEFLYFQSILITLQVANVLFFLLTVYYLVDHWRKAATMIKRETKGHFLIVLKLFFIMGVQWFSEIFSQAITHVTGPRSSSFKYTLALDLPNLFTGVLVFIVLVCKKKTVKRVSTRILRNTSRLSRGSVVNTTTSVVVKDRDSCSTREGLLSKETIELCRLAQNQSGPNKMTHGDY